MLFALLIIPKNTICHRHNPRLVTIWHVFAFQLLMSIDYSGVTLDDFRCELLKARASAKDRKLAIEIIFPAACADPALQCV